MVNDAPRQGCSVFRPGVEEGRMPRRRPRDSSVGKKTPRPRQGVALSSLPGECDTLRGRISFLKSSFPGSSALRALTPGLKAGDPSGASPLRDLQDGLHSDRDYHFFAVELKCVSPGNSYTAREVFFSSAKRSGPMTKRSERRYSSSNSLRSKKPTNTA